MAEDVRNEWPNWHICFNYSVANSGRADGGVSTVSRGSRDFISASILPDYGPVDRKRSAELKASLLSQTGATLLSPTKVGQEVRAA